MVIERGEAPSGHDGHDAGAPQAPGAAGGYRTAAEQAGLSPEQTLLERLLSWSEINPRHVCLERIDGVSGDNLKATPFTVAALLEGARTRAARLAQLGIGPGDRVLLCLPNSEAFVVWLLGAHWLGAAPVPLPSLAGFGSKASLVERLRGVMEDCRPRALVADGATRRALKDLAHGIAERCTLIDADAKDDEDVGHLARSPFPAKGDDTAIIQYTSGSTGGPRGVLVTHHNLRSNLEASARQLRCSAEDRVLTWLPVYHDMGLVGGLLTPLYGGFTSLLMTPLAFVTRPSRWLRAIGQFRATISIAPNFAYAMCLRKLRDQDLAGVDLRTWRVAMNGAEPIDPVTATGFVERFERWGLRRGAFYPVYGLAEATLAVAFPEPGEPVHIDQVDRAALGGGTASPAPGRTDPGVVSFVSVGRPIPGHDFEIREPERDTLCPERKVGEIVARGPSITPGYFRREGPAPPQNVLRTGDLGYVADGRLYVIDRIKDLIIVAGRNVSPSDIERSIQLEGVRRGRAVAFGIADAESGTERVVVVAEGAVQERRDLESTRDRIRAAVLANHQLSLHDVVLVEAGTLPRTSSGKVMRRHTRELYLAKRLVLAGTMTPLQRAWKKVLGRALGIIHRVTSRG